MFICLYVRFIYVHLSVCKVLFIPKIAVSVKVSWFLEKFIFCVFNSINTIFTDIALHISNYYINILLKWNILANPVIWLVNQAGDINLHPLVGPGIWQDFFGKMASHRYYYKKKMLKQYVCTDFPPISVPILIFLFVKRRYNQISGIASQFVSVFSSASVMGTLQ